MITCKKSIAVSCHLILFDLDIHIIYMREKGMTKNAQIDLDTMLKKLLKI